MADEGKWTLRPEEGLVWFVKSVEFSHETSANTLHTMIASILTRHLQPSSNSILVLFAVDAPCSWEIQRLSLIPETAGNQSQYLRRQGWNFPQNQIDFSGHDSLDYLCVGIREEVILPGAVGIGLSVQKSFSRRSRQVCSGVV